MGLSCSWAFPLWILLLLWPFSKQIPSAGWDPSPAGLFPFYPSAGRIPSLDLGFSSRERSSQGENGGVIPHPEFLGILAAFNYGAAGKPSLLIKPLCVAVGGRIHPGILPHLVVQLVLIRVNYTPEVSAASSQHHSPSNPVGILGNVAVRNAGRCYPGF